MPISIILRVIPIKFETLKPPNVHCALLGETIYCKQLDSQETRYNRALYFKDFPAVLAKNWPAGKKLGVMVGYLQFLVTTESNGRT